MKPRSAGVLLLVLGVSAVCVRLGFWQISRWHEKRALNVAIRHALEAPPLFIGSGPGSPDSIRGRRVEVRGHYDESRQILLSGRAHSGSPGVEVVTPFLLSGGRGAVLVDRGWLYAADAARARPQTCPEPGERTVLGMTDPLRQGAGGAPIRELESDSVTLYSARWLDLDSLAWRFPYPLAAYVIRQTPGPGVPQRPLRRAAALLDETMHVSYAIQWFLFAVILLAGSAALARSRKRMQSVGSPRPNGA